MKNNLKKMIVLVGLMGAGKTSVGKRLADCINVGFSDSDKEIEEAAGMKITEIFDRFGEEYFRAGEARVISRLLGKAPGVLATGGGAFMSKDIRTLFKSSATTIWLKADLETLWSRVSGSQSRPLLKGLNPKQTLESLIKVRYPIYKKSDLVINSHANISQTHIVNKIVQSLETSKILIRQT